MAGHNNLHPDEFVDPSEFINQIGMMEHDEDDQGRRLPRSVTWQRKLADAEKPATTRDRYAGLYDRISKEGVRNPVTVIPGQEGQPGRLFEGYHRAAIADAVQRRTGKPFPLPVKYVEEADLFKSEPEPERPRPAPPVYEDDLG